MPLTLRGYQQEGVDALRGVLRGGAWAPLYVLPTGGGKTAVFTYITESAGAKGREVWILVHRKELVIQASRSLAQFGVAHGIIAPHDKVRAAMSDHMDRFGQSLVDQFARIHVASVQTLVRRLDKIRRPPDLLVIDEAHHAPAGQWAKIIDAFPRAVRLGVTATPVRSDGQGLGQHFDALVQGPSISQLIEEGYLSPPTVYAPPSQLNLDGVHTRKGDYVTKEVAERVDTPKVTGDAVAHYGRICPGVPAIAFCASVRHAEHVAEEFRAAGWNAASVDGSMDDMQRDRRIRDLGEGKLHVLTSCDIISEGTDVPIVGAALLLRPTKSLGLYLQQVGRALRPYPGKERTIILDHVGNSLVHGPPDEDREWSLEGTGAGEQGRGTKAPEGPKTRQCPQCYHVHKLQLACPACGYEYDDGGRVPEQVEGELTEMTKEQKEALKRERKKEVARAKSLEDLQKIEKQRGYKPGWARHVYNARQGKQRRAANG
ncbi:MAG: DEAD/DEAH box helicase [Thiohalorhabdus sp.]